MKYMSPEIVKLEQTIQRAIFARFGISEEDWGEVKRADEAEESTDLQAVRHGVPGWIASQYAPGLSQREAYELFMQTATELGIAVH